MATARSYHQQSISQLLHPLRRSYFASRTQRVFIPRPVSAARGSAREASGGDLSPEEKRTAARKAPRAPRRLITISTADGRWQGEWCCDYVFSLKELGVADVADLGQSDSKVLISLVVQKHAGFGFSVEGKIGTSFNRRCSGCFCSFEKEIDASFDVWVLPSSKSDPMELPEIGSGDPSVIYVKPGTEADLDSLIRDTIRLAVTANQVMMKFFRERYDVDNDDDDEDDDEMFFRVLARRPVRNPLRDGTMLTRRRGRTTGGGPDFWRYGTCFLDSDGGFIYLKAGIQRSKVAQNFYVTKSKRKVLRNRRGSGYPIGIINYSAPIFEGSEKFETKM